MLKKLHNGDSRTLREGKQHRYHSFVLTLLLEPPPAVDPSNHDIAKGTKGANEQTSFELVNAPEYYIYIYILEIKARQRQARRNMYFMFVASQMKAGHP